VVCETDSFCSYTSCVHTSSSLFIACSRLFMYSSCYLGVCCVRKHKRILFLRSSAQLCCECSGASITRVHRQAGQREHTRWMWRSRALRALSSRAICSSETRPSAHQQCRYAFMRDATTTLHPVVDLCTRMRYAACLPLVAYSLIDNCFIPLIERVLPAAWNVLAGVRYRGVFCASQTRQYRTCTLTSGRCHELFSTSGRVRSHRGFKLGR
jgi:hypothetical protein